jgi:putative serine protease PepD
MRVFGAGSVRREGRKVSGEAVTYRFTARQVLLAVLLSAMLAAASVASVFGGGRLLSAVAANEGAGAPASVTDPTVAGDERNNIEVYRAAAPGVVFITTSEAGGGDLFDAGERRGAGAGCVIDEQGHILTNDHVVEGASRLTVSLGGDRRYAARVVGRDPDTDLAVIQIDAPPEQLQVIPLGDSDALEVGQKVLAIGNPFGLDRTLTIGVISGLQRPIRSRTGRVIEGAIQTDASINPGNSGGPLLDSRGRMIGINSQILSPAGGSVGVGFAIPVNIVKRVVPQLIGAGFVSRPRLGAAVRGVRDLGGQIRTPVSDGVIVLRVTPNGPAAAAGLRGLSRDREGAVVLGDIITGVDGEKVGDGDDLTHILDKHQAGDTIELEVVRDGARLKVPLRLLAERRSAQGPKQSEG